MKARIATIITFSSEAENHRFIVEPSQRFYQCIDCGFRKPYDGGSTPYPYAYTIIE